MSDIYERALRAELTEKHIILILAILGGMLGADQAYRGKIFLALVKTITVGGLFIWYLLDIWASARNASVCWRSYEKHLRQQSLKN